MALACHVILQDHVIQGSCNFMSGTTSHGNTAARFGGDWHRGGGDLLLVYHVISQ